MLRFDEIRVEDVLTPRTVAVMFPAGATIGELLEDPRVEAFSRIPLYEGSPDQVVGYLLMREVLHAVTKGTDVATPLSRFLILAAWQEGMSGSLTRSRGWGARILAPRSSFH